MFSYRKRLLVLALTPFVLSVEQACAETATVYADSAKLTAGADTSTLTISSGRPLMRAALILQALYGYVITYEDPRFSNPDDVVDIGSTMVKGTTEGRPPKGSKLMVPKDSQYSI